MSHYLAIDIETSGPNMTKNFMVALGACVVNVTQQRVPNPIEDRFLIYLDAPEGTHWDAKCRIDFWDNREKAINGKTLYDILQKDMATYGTHSPEVAMNKFVDWLQQMIQKYPDLVIITDTADFDAGWVNYYLTKYATHSPFPCLSYATGEYKTVRDVSSFYAGIGRKTPLQGFSGAEKAALQKLGKQRFPNFGVNYDHNPLNDALTIAHQAAYISNVIDESCQ